MTHQHVHLAVPLSCLADHLAQFLVAPFRFDYSKAKPNRFASRVDPTRLVVALDPDVAEVFTTPDAVNNILRALIQTMPGKNKARGRA